MKKIIQISMFFCFGIHGFNYSIENKTDGQIQILLEYEADSLCTPTERIIAKDQIVTIKSGLCRAHHITIKGQDDSFEIQKQLNNKEFQNCEIQLRNEETVSKTSPQKLKIHVSVSYQSK
jgi:hypothetical protein